jgi:hypothetical protein
MDATFERVIAGENALREQFVHAYSHARALLQNDKRVHVVVKEALDPVSAKQRGFLHGVILPQIAEQVFVGPQRERFTEKVWKEYYFDRLVKPEYEMRKLPNQKRPTPHRINTSSEHLGTRAYAEWIDKIIDDAVAEWKVEFSFDPTERAAVRPASKPRQAFRNSQL